MNKTHLVIAIGGAQAFEEIGAVSKLYNHFVHKYADGKKYDPFDVTLNGGLIEKNIGDHKVYIVDVSLGDANGHLEEYYRHVIEKEVSDEEHYMTAQALEVMEMIVKKIDRSKGFVFTTKHNELVITPLNKTTKHKGE